MIKATPQWKSDILARIDQICSLEGKVPRSVAYQAIEDSAWWEDHPSGPVRAPKHATRIEGRDGRWYLELGANSFLISTAIFRCCNRIKEWSQKQNGVITTNSLISLYSCLSGALRGSVVNCNGEEYDYYGAGSKDKIKFGTQAISIKGFIRSIASKLKFSELYHIDGITGTQNFPTSPTSNVSTQQISMTRCPLCNTEVSLKNLQKHINTRCPKNKSRKNLTTIDLTPLHIPFVD